MYLRKNQICWKSTRYLDISQDIAVHHLVQRHIVRDPVTGQVRDSVSRLSLIPALTCSHGQPEAAYQ